MERKQEIHFRHPLDGNVLFCGADGQAREFRSAATIYMPATA